MFTHYLKIAWRNILNDKGYSAINIVGLSIALSCCLLLVFWVKFELSYEKCYPKSESIFRLMVEEQRTERIYNISDIRPGITEKLKASFPQIKYATLTRNEKLPFTVEGKEGDGIMANQLKVNEDFLRIFAYEYVEGSPQSVVDNKGSIMSEEIARKFFGKESAIGKTVEFGHSGMFRHYIAAVVKVPENTHVNFDILTPTRDERFGGVHYVKLNDGYQLTPEFEEQVADFLATTNETENKLRLQPIRRMHFHSPEEVKDNSYGSIAEVYLFVGVALLILLIAIINYVNTSIARSINRMKEVGVRKTFGAKRKQLIQQFLIESFILSFIAVFVSLVLVELLFPFFSNIMGKRVLFDFNFMAIIIALVACIVVTLLSGGYAAFYLSSYSPISILRGITVTGKKQRVRGGLIGVQFFLCISVLICTVFIYRQMGVIFNVDTGVDKENILILETSLWNDAENFIQTIKKENANIIDATIAFSAPYNSSYNYSGVSWTGSDDDTRELAFTQIFCDHNYASTFGLQMLQGEFIPPGLSWWQYADEKSFDIVINESFKKLIGLDNPVGTVVSYGWGLSGRIIGVVKDFNFKPLKEPVSPLIISYNPEVSSNVYIKTTGNDKKATRDYILAKYKEMKNNTRPVMYHTVEDEYKEMYVAEFRTAGVSSVFSVISLFLSLMGIVALISFMIEKRTKEIAIRRINGAKTGHIIQLFLHENLIGVLIASIISIPLCYLIMYNWLESYLFRTSLVWWIFVVIPLFVVLITVSVIAMQIYFTARKNLTESFKSDY